MIRELPITNLTGLENLGTINDELLIEDNPYLMTLEQLGSDLPDEYRTNIRNINVKNNLQLQDVEGLGCFQNMTGTSIYLSKISTLDSSFVAHERQATIIRLSYSAQVYWPLLVLQT